MTLKPGRPNFHFQQFCAKSTCLCVLSKVQDISAKLIRSPVPLILGYCRYDINLQLSYSGDAGKHSVPDDNGSNMNTTAV